VGPEDLLDLVHERARDRLALPRVELVTGAVDAALGTTVGDVDECRLPRHQHRERPRLVDVDLGVEAEAALVGAASAVVLHAVARVDLERAVVHPHRDLYRHLAVCRAHHLADLVRQAEPLAGEVEVVGDDLIVRDRRALTWPGRAVGGRGLARRLDRGLGDRAGRLWGLPRFRPYRRSLLLPRHLSAHYPTYAGAPQSARTSCRFAPRAVEPAHPPDP